MAGIMALIVQKAGGAPQGLPNPVFYKLAAAQALGSCASLGVVASNSCVFYDITEDNNAQPCSAGSLNCNVNTKGDAYGVLSGYKAGPGYDLATGLGSVNAYNLVNSWTSAAPSAAVSITPSSLTFPSTVVGKSAPPQTLTVKNTGAGWLNFPANGFHLYGTDYKSFPTVGNCYGSQAPGTSCAATVTFTPQSAGTLTTQIVIDNNAPKSPQTVQMTGTATAGIVVTLSQTALNFIYTTVGTTSNYESLSATNTGSSAVKVAPIVIGGADPSSFSEVNTCGTSLAGGATCWIYVVFKPASWAYLTATLSFSDSADGAQTVTLDGSGESTPTVTLSPTSLTFAATALGTMSPPQTVTLTNTGTWLLSVSVIEIVGENASSFFEFDDCQGAGYISRQQSCTIEVVLDPVSNGAQSAVMYILDNGVGAPQAVKLTGTGKIVF